MKKLALVSLLAVAASAAFAQSVGDGGVRSASSPVMVTVNDYAQLDLSGAPALTVTDGGQQGSYDIAGLTYRVRNNVHVIATPVVSSQGTLTGGVAGHISLDGTHGDGNTAGFAAGDVSANPALIWADGFTLTNSHANTGASFTVMISLSVG